MAFHVPMPPTFTLALAGDVMLGRLMNEALARHGPEAPWRAVRPLIAGSDLFFYNLECAVCGDLPEWEPVAKTFHFRMDPCHLETLHASGVHAVGLANNHTLDHDVDGLVETLEHLDAMGVPHAGAGRTLADAQAPALVENATGTRVALVCAADHPREWAATNERPGIFWLDPGAPEGLDAATTAVRAARDIHGADLVVLGLHWGPNMRRVPPETFRRFARRLTEAGADVVWGTSAHLPQGIEFHAERVILYDTGDFLDDYAVDPEEHNDLSFLFRVVFDGGRVARVDLHPVTIERFATRPARPHEAAWNVAVERQLCEAFGTRVEPRGERTWSALPPRAPA